MPLDVLSYEELLESYLNGPRTLSNERLSYLIVSQKKDEQGSERNIDFLICATHFLGDGMALHQFANDFFSLLGGELDEAGLLKKLDLEWNERCAKEVRHRQYSCARTSTDTILVVLEPSCRC